MSGTEYDYIIAGAGLSGLSLAHRIAQMPGLAQKHVLVIDQTLASANDKTWSFWTSEKPPFSKLIYKSWRQVRVAFGDEYLLQQLHEYTYHSIHSGRFRKTIIDNLRLCPNIDLVESAIQTIKGDEHQAVLQTEENQYTASYIFQSCFTPPALKNDPPCYPLIQHFLGWEIETDKDVFDASTITLMDFDPGFSAGVAFVYILPQSPRKALMEYTIFSDQVRDKAFYQEKLRIYLNNRFNLGPLNFSVIRTEYGQIPMQDHKDVPWHAPRVLNMGTAGGLTKPSTGYTFSRIQNHVQQITHSLLNDTPPALPYRSSFRYRAYDLWLLQIIHEHPREALQIFRQLFNNNSMDDIFRFLSEENSLLQDMKTMSHVSYGPFFRAMWKTRKRLFEI